MLVLVGLDHLADDAALLEGEPTWHRPRAGGRVLESARELALLPLAKARAGEAEDAERGDPTNGELGAGDNAEDTPLRRCR